MPKPTRIMMSPTINSNPKLIFKNKTKFRWFEQLSSELIWLASDDGTSPSLCKKSAAHGT